MGSFKVRALRRGVCSTRILTGESVNSISTANNQTLALPAATVTEAIPDYDGLLPIAALENDLQITLPWWNGVQNRTRLQVAWKAFVPDDPDQPGSTDLVGTYYEVTPAEVADPTAVFKVLVPQNLLEHGVYLLRVRAQTVPGNVLDWAPTLTVRVDREAPGGGALPYLSFSPEVETSKKIQDSDIISGELPVELAHYEGIAKGDLIELYINQTPYYSEELTAAPDPGQEFIRLRYLETDLEDAGNGSRLFSYKVTDRAGNFAGSRAVGLDVQLHTTPTDIPAPTVPQADPDLLNEAEARSGTQVDITPYDLPQIGDEIMVHWGGQTSDKVSLKADDLVNDPYTTIVLPYAMVLAETSKGSVDVTYEVFRAGLSVGVSLVNTVEVDLTVPGGPDPDPTTPVNENLEPVIVRSANAGNPPPPGEDNVIPPGDFDQNATAIVPWLAVDGTDIYEIDDVLKLTWGSQTGLPVARLILQQDIDDAVDLRLTVPGTTIVAEGAGDDIPVFYTITRKATPPNENTAIAPSTLVKVTGPDDLPGKNHIDPPTFTRLNEFDAIGQNELIGILGSRYNPVQTSVIYDNVVAGDKVEVFFNGYDDLDAGNLIPAASYTDARTLTQADINRGTYDFNIPAIYHVAVCSQGRVTAHVAFTNDRGTANSNDAGAYCDVKYPGDPDCSGYEV